MNLQKRKRLTDLENKLIVAVWEGIVTDFGKVRCTLLYLKWITNKDLLYSTWNSAQCYVAAGWEESLEANGYMVSMIRFLCCTPETVTTLLMD